MGLRVGESGGRGLRWGWVGVRGCMHEARSPLWVVNSPRLPPDNGTFFAEIDGQTS